MNQFSEKEQKIFNKYPEIFRNTNLSVKQSCMAWGLDCPTQWFDKIEFACSLLNNLSFRGTKAEFIAVQVKEKFGELRFYYDLDFAEEGYDEANVKYIEKFVELIIDNTEKECYEPLLCPKK